VGNYGNYGPGTNPGTFSIIPDPLTGARQEAIDKCTARLKGETWNLGTFLGELPETQRFVADVGKALWKSYKAVRRGDLRALSRMWFPRFKGNRYRGRDGKPITDSWVNIVVKPTGQSLASKWLAWRYAVSPMMYDLDDAMKELYGRSQVVAPVLTARGKSKGQWRNSAVSGSGLTTDSSSSWNVFCGIYYRVSPTVAAFKRLGLLNALSVLWELTPLSFVFDWFIPVGKYLGALDAAAGVTFIGRFITTVQTKSQVVVGRHADGSTQGPAEYKWRQTARLNSFTLVPPIPTWSPNLNFLRQVDALSLLFNGLTKTRPKAG
jgi:hypothetical protein